MDLAKIRQKSRQERENRHEEKSLPLTVESRTSATPRDFVSLGQISDERYISEDVEPVTVSTVFPANPQDVPPSRSVQRDPLAVILAGREAAGCDDYLTDASGEDSDAEAAEYVKYLCFRVSDEVYGVNIMDIKELITPREVTEVPRAPSFVSGVISLRGTIIPIINMLDRLGLARETATGRERVIVVRNGESFSGLLVDEIIQVVSISINCIEAAPTVLAGIDRDFVTGIGRADGRMIILLNLENITDIHLY